MPRITERYAAIVTHNDDPKKLGRIQVKSADLIGDGDVSIPEWIDPCFDWGWFFVPDIGEEVEIEAVVQDDYQEDAAYQAFVEAPDFRWRGKRFVSAEGESPRAPNAFFTNTNYGKRRGFMTPRGHVLMFDDTKGAEQITLAWKGDAEETMSHLSFDSTGSVILSNARGTMLYLNAPDGQMLFVDEHGNNISTSDTGVKIIDLNGNVIEMNSTTIQIISQAAVSVRSSQSVGVEAPQINLGQGANSPIPRWTDLNAWLLGHTHLTAFGPSGPGAASTNGPPPPTIGSLVSNTI